MMRPIIHEVIFNLAYGSGAYLDAMEKDIKIGLTLACALEGGKDQEGRLVTELPEKGFVFGVSNPVDR